MDEPVKIAYRAGRTSASYGCADNPYDAKRNPLEHAAWQVGYKDQREDMMYDCSGQQTKAKGDGQ